ncbi:pseudouridine synthase [Rhodohalobacter halophilus]|uniref:pseudouridine synthase n=1 Tax=Rhodohalobacter halophilus TaxID=1812810 RepID=UPI000A0360AD|nr:pseudouridine synthase [Rhodohalobacter halophilus]
MKKKRPERSQSSERQQRSERSQNSERQQRSERPQSSERRQRPDRKRNSDKPFSQKKSSSKPRKAKRARKGPNFSNRAKQEKYLREEIRLNKFIAHAGFCSRRDADEYIEAGKVKINGEVVTELGTKVTTDDKVEVDGQRVSLEPFVYILLNKGKDTISTTDDEKDRNTVMDAIEDATGYRVYPVGRLDRNTMGLLLLTNDGDLAHRLMHPSYKVKKTYEVETDRILTDEELSEMVQGITLEDGPIQPTKISRSGYKPNIVIITVFEGRNHLIRRMIAYFGADVKRLKRIRYAGLNDKDMRVGRWRYLKQKEINDLRKLVKLDTLDFNKEGA